MTKHPKIFLINLKDSTDRLKRSSDQLSYQNIDFERIDAIHGKYLSNDNILEHYSKELNSKSYYRSLSLGEIGCYLSHRKAWQRIVDLKLDYAIIMEDDFKLVGDLNKVFNALESLNNQWDIIKLASYNNRERPIRYKTQIDADFEIVIHNKTMTGCCAQAITYKGAKKLIEFSQQFGRPVDTDIQHIWETGIPAVSLMPYYIEQDLSIDSDIAQVANRERIKKGFFKRKKQQFFEKIHNRQATNKVIAQTKSWVIEKEIGIKPL